jgi:hypothetical protein
MALRRDESYRRAWVHTGEMNQTNVMLAIVQMAEAGGAVQPDDAIAIVAALIDRQKMFTDDYERDTEALMRIGACIWQMRQARD